jgi:hypothetical protein
MTVECLQVGWILERSMSDVRNLKKILERSNNEDITSEVWKLKRSSYSVSSMMVECKTNWPKDLAT